MIVKSLTHRTKFLLIFTIAFTLLYSIEVKAATVARVAKLAYDIESVSIDSADETLRIKGWAFNTASDVGFAGHTSLQFKLSSSDGSESISPKAVFLHSSYSLGRWLCDKDVNPSTGAPYDYCKEGSLAIGGTGFEVAFDLNSSEIKDGKTYKVMMKHPGMLNSSWKEISVARAVIADNVMEFNKRRKDQMAMSIGGGTNTIKITERSVQMVGSDGKPLSPSQNFTGASYSITGQPIKVDISNGGGGINLYPVTVNSGIAYVPSVFGEISGANGSNWLVIKTSKREDEGSNELQFNNGTPRLPDPEGCTGEVYNFFYFFLGGWTDMPQNWVSNSAGSAGFNDGEILKQLEIDTNTVYRKFVVPIDKDSIGWFYTAYPKAMSNHEKKYFNEGNNYFFAYDWWCRANGECYDQYSGCKLDASKNPTSECNPNKATQGVLSMSEYQNASIMLGTPLSGGSALKINETQSEDGFKFSIQRYFSGNPYQIANPRSLAVQAKTGKNDQYLHPAVYAMSICKGDKPQCDDSVDPAVCLTGDTGTEVIFHESDELATCTLNKEVSSGFTIIEKEETGGYCEVACKDDLDIKLPSGKETAAGQYFVLDNYTPEIKAKRTCVTSQIDSQKFIEDKKGKEVDVSKLYNIWRDWVEINGQENGSNYEEGRSKINGPNEITSDVRKCYTFAYTTNEDNERVRDEENDVEVGTLRHYEWNINSSTGPNGTRYDGSEAKGDFYKLDEGGSLGDYCITSSESIPDEADDEDEYNFQDKSKETYDREIEYELSDARRNYEDSLAEYSEMLNNYNKCYSWTDNVMNAIQDGTNLKSGTAGSEKDRYQFTFKPTLTFDYGYENPLERDRDVFAPFTWGEEQYDDDRYVEQSALNTSNTYWAKGVTTDTKYTGGVQANGNSPKGLNADPLGLLKCEGTTCSATGSLDTNHYFYTSSYVKREEDIQYTYHLPTVYASIPVGSVTTDEHKYDPRLQLAKDAVPVNINTPSGTYPYKLTIDNLKDELRREKSSNNPNDDWDDRFKGSKGAGALNEADAYVCNYDVINDIYIPGSPGKLNFFYRIIDPYEINPLGRTLGYNWANPKGDTAREEIKKMASDYGDMSNPNDGEKDKFIFTLTPLIMKEIRNHNSDVMVNGGFANFEMACTPYIDEYGNRMNQGYHCRSQFLSCLASGGDGYGETKSCYNTFRNNLNNYRASEDNYDLGRLNINRDKLISKQNKLDCDNGIEDACG